jgi:hypothetical protein
MQLVPHSPTVGVYPATDDYVHAMEVRDPSRFLFVAGTMGLDEHGMAATTLDEQLELIWRNIGATPPMPRRMQPRASVLSEADASRPRRSSP